MAKKEAKARVKINRLLERAGWHFGIPNGERANIEVESSVKDLKSPGDNFEKVQRGFVDYTLLDKDYFLLHCPP